MSRRANGEGSIYPYRNGFAAYVWIVTPRGRRQRKTVYGKTRSEVHDKWLRLHEQAATTSNYDMFTRLYIIPDLGDRKLDKLMVRDVQVWVNTLRVRCQLLLSGQGCRAA